MIVMDIDLCFWVNDIVRARIFFRAMCLDSHSDLIREGEDI